MTPSEKAKELIDKFSVYVQKTNFGQSPPDYNPKLKRKNAKACAIICVDEILEALGSEGVWSFADADVSNFFTDVKTELQKL